MIFLRINGPNFVQFKGKSGPVHEPVYLDLQTYTNKITDNKHRPTG